MTFSQRAIILIAPALLCTFALQMPLCANPPSAKPAAASESGNAEISVAEQFESARAMLQKWSETQSMIAREQREWQQGKVLLQQRMELIEREIEATQKKIKESRKTLDSNKAEKGKILEETAEATKNGEILKKEIPALEEKVRALFKQVPVQVQDKGKAFYTGIETAEGSAKMALAARYMSVVSLATLFGKSNTEVIQGPQTILLPNGELAEVNVIYFGLGQGYYITKNGSEAGTGKPTPKGWVWQKDNAIADKLVGMLEVLKKSGAPKIVPLPASIQ